MKKNLPLFLLLFPLLSQGRGMQEMQINSEKMLINKPDFEEREKMIAFQTDDVVGERRIISFQTIIHLRFYYLARDKNAQTLPILLLWLIRALRLLLF